MTDDTSLSEIPHPIGFTRSITGELNSSVRADYTPESGTGDTISVILSAVTNERDRTTAVVDVAVNGLIRRTWERLPIGDLGIPYRLAREMGPILGLTQGNNNLEVIFADAAGLAQAKAKGGDSGWVRLDQGEITDRETDFIIDDFVEEAMRHLRVADWEGWKSMFDLFNGALISHEELEVEGLPYVVRKHGPWVILDWEVEKAIRQQRRLDAIARGLGVDRSELHIIWKSMSGYLHQNVEGVIDRILKEGAIGVTIDSAFAARGGAMDEADLHRFIGAQRDIVQATGAAVVVLDHVNAKDAKANKAVTPGGLRQHAGQARHLLGQVVWPLSSGSYRLDFEIHKDNDGGKRKFSLRADFPEKGVLKFAPFVGLTGGETVIGADKPGEGPTSSDQFILAVAQGHHTVDEIREFTGWSKPQVRTNAGRADGELFVTGKDGNRNVYSLSDKGRSYVQQFGVGLPEDPPELMAAGDE